MPILHAATPVASWVHRRNRIRRGVGPSYTWRELLDEHGWGDGWRRYHDDSTPSRYGDPEQALVDGLPADDHDDDDAVRAELHEAVGELHLVDRWLLELTSRGAYQADLAATLGISQPSVSIRLAKIREWCGHVVPVRMRARNAAEPERWNARRAGRHRPFGNNELARIWRLVFWHHRSSVEVGRVLGIHQGRASRGIHRAVEAVRLRGDPMLAEAAEVIVADVHAWRRPLLTFEPPPELAEAAGETDSLLFR